MNKILFLSPHPEWGGSATANIVIAKMLMGIGFEVIYNDEYAGFNSYNEVQIFHIPFHKEKQNRNQRLIDYVNKNKISAVFWGVIQLFAFYQPAINYFKKAGVLQITIFHSLSFTKGIRGQISEWISAFSLRRMDHIIFVSEYTLKSWSKYLFIRKSVNRCHVIHNAVILPSSKHSVKDKHNLSIGYVGRFSVEKQPDIFCQLSDRFPGRCVAFGNGPLLERCKEKYKHVRFMGEIKDQDLIYENIDVLVLTSQFENCPMVILEAMSRGIPCVAPNVGGIPEIVKKHVNGSIYNSYDIDEIYDAVVEIACNYDYYRNQCLVISESFSTTEIANQWRQLLK